MSSKKALKLRQLILKHNTELSKLREQLETSEEANLRFNKTLIQKAICKKELDDSGVSLVQKFIKKFRHSSNSNGKLICDYFSK